MRSLYGLLTLLAAMLLVPESAVPDILSTKHNLSVSGPGTIKATTEDRVCVFCHTPHHASDVTPLWNRQMSSAIYNLYASTTLVSSPGQPTGGARLCLSCHDGTIAVGMLFGRPDPVPMTGGISSLPPGGSNLGTDLIDDHPISLAYTSSLATERGELVDPALLPTEIQLEDGVMLQCTACHNPHKDPYGMFLVIDNAYSGLCTSCHARTGWAASSHATDPAMAETGCQNCHAPHGATGFSHLLRGTTEEGNCMTNCHNGSGSGVAVQSDFSKFYAHPVTATAGIHDMTENPASMSKHVECQDCHNAHQLNAQDAPLSAAPAISGRLKGVRGISASGTLVEEAAYEYEVCFKCHADNQFVYAVTVPRVISENNERLRFDLANPSYHPVVGAGKNSHVPSLRPEWSEADSIYCVDCHASDDSRRGGGSGAEGPHGSIYPHLLLAQYEQDSYPLPYAASNYALCFRCHNPDALFNPALSTFGNSHVSHVQVKQVPCSACHDPHGVPAARGATAAANAHLINFDTRFVDPLTAIYDSGARSCTVSCHVSNPKIY